MFIKNIKIEKRMKMNMWRQVALTSWDRPNEPVIFSKVELNPEKLLDYIKTKNQNSQLKITMTSVIGKICGILLHKHEDLNSTILMKRAYVRQGSDIFFHVSSIDKNGKENLSGVKVEDCAFKTIEQIATEIQSQGSLVKSGKDVSFEKAKRVMKLTPLWLSKYVIWLTTFIQYRLNLWHPIIGTKRDSFGAMMLTNIGSLGLKEAFVPFPQYTNVNSILALGTCYEAPIVEDGELRVGKVQNACWTLDHRVVDGSNAAKMLETFQEFYNNPQRIDEFDKEHNIT